MTITYALIAKLVGALALIGLGFGLGYKFEHGSVLAAQAELTSYKAKEARAVADQEKKNAQIVAKHDALSNEIQGDYAKRLVQLQENYDAKTSTPARIACGMRDSASRGNVSATPSASQGIDADPTDRLAARLPQDCADTTLQLEDLQQWAAGIAH